MKRRREEEEEEEKGGRKGGELDKDKKFRREKERGREVKIG